MHSQNLKRVWRGASDLTLCLQGKKCQSHVGTVESTSIDKAAPLGWHDLTLQRSLLGHSTYTDHLFLIYIITHYCIFIIWLFGLFFCQITVKKPTYFADTLTNSGALFLSALQVELSTQGEEDILPSISFFHQYLYFYSKLLVFLIINVVPQKSNQSV